MDTVTLTSVLILALASILMVVAMVRFSTAIVAAPTQSSAAKRWGVVYAIAWAVIITIMVRLAIAPDFSWQQALAAMVPLAGGWGTFQAFWVWLGLSIERTNARATGQAVTLTPPKEAIRRRAGQLAAGGLVLVCLAVIELGYVRAALAGLVTPSDRALAATLSIAILGFALLLVGGMRLMLRSGKPMSHAEIEEDLRWAKYGPQGRTGPLRFRWSTYRHFGLAEGAKAEQEVSIAEMKAAWHSRAWRRDPMWQTVFLMTAGGLMITLGAFGAVLVVGTLVVKVLCGGVFGYTAFQLIRAVRQS